MTDILLSVHMQLAAITRCPEMEIEKDEAKKLADAAANVASYYDIAIDPKHAAWAKLYGVLGVIYGTRIYAIRMRKKMEKADRTKPADAAPAEEQPIDGNVVPMRPGDYGGPGSNLDSDRPGG